MKLLLRTLLRSESNGLAGMALDGPRGPFHRIQPGTRWLSQTAEIPVYPVAIRAAAAVRLNNWDKTLIPLPFSTISIRIGRPFFPGKNKDLEEKCSGMKKCTLKDQA
jgi:lysophospholipid acyltransferase (LPLAT)-like uncharacterized protein